MYIQTFLCTFYKILDYKTKHFKNPRFFLQYLSNYFKNNYLFNFIFIMREETEMAGDSAMTLIRMEGAVSLFANN